MEYRKLNAGEISHSLFTGFRRTQTVTRCWRKTDGEWVLRDAPFTDDWSAEEVCQLILELRRLAEGGGAVFAALDDGKLAGFASVEAEPIGSRKQYLDLTNLHVSQEQRRKGIGKTLFQLAVGFAREKGVPKLYLSAHSAMETQAFYRAMGCIEAEEYQSTHVEQEPFDCQMEYRLP